jgi:hypothetical protein
MPGLIVPLRPHMEAGIEHVVPNTPIKRLRPTDIYEADSSMKFYLSILNNLIN